MSRENMQLSPERLEQLLFCMDKLGLPHQKNANDVMTLPRDIVRKAHRRMSLLYHPDRIANDDPTTRKAFVDTQRAYEALIHFLDFRDSVDVFATYTPQPVPETEPKKATVISVGGAKGGVGKSFISSSLAIALAAAGKRVLAVDLDLGGANLHLLLGIKHIKRSLGDFLFNKDVHLMSLIQKTQFANLHLLPGNSANLGTANHPYQKKLALIRRLQALPYDIILCDLGAGTSYNTLDYFLMADQQYVVTTSEPTSVLDSYALIKTALYRLVSHSIKTAKGNPDLVNKVKDFLYSGKQEQISSLKILVSTIREMDPALAAQLRNWIRSFRINLVLNRSKGDHEYMLLSRIMDLASINLGVTGITPITVPHHSHVPDAITRLEPFMASHPDSTAANAIIEMAAGVVGKNKEATVAQIRYTLENDPYEHAENS